MNKQVKKFKLSDCEVELQDNFYDIIEEAVEDTGYKSIHEIFNILDEKEDSEAKSKAWSDLFFMITDSIEACIYNAMRNIVTYHSDEHYTKNNYDEALIKAIESQDSFIDDLHDFELLYEDCIVHYMKDEINPNNSYIEVKLSKIAGLTKTMKININVFNDNSDSTREFLQNQLDNLLKEVIKESPYGLMDKLFIEE